MKSTKVVIVVLGDIGHSPRMCNHAYSFAQKENVEVEIFGYLHSKPHEKIFNSEKIRIHPLNQPPSFLSSQFWLMRMLMLPIKFIFMIISLITVAKVCNKSLENSKKRIMLVQNPPGIPTMFACYLIAKLYKMLYVIDWHNYTFSLLRIPFLIEPLEGYLGRLSDLNICVSKTMQNDLKCRWGIEATVFYDRPPNYLFKKNAEEEVNENFMEEFISDSSIKETILASNVLDSTDISGLIKLNDKSKRPFILVSSTSWTPDEDFSLLLNALKYYDNYCNENRHQSQFPKIFVIITGKGPEKEMYLEKIGRMEWTNVFIVTAWLKAENYPKLLSCADIGVCLHTSTSGFDLPMKIVDMFGCHLPVLAKNFKAISELVEDGTNGILFDTDEELSDAIIKLTKDFPQNEVLADMQNNLQNGISSWEENWEEVLVPLFGLTN